MRPSVSLASLVVFAFLGGCAARSALVERPVPKPALAATSSAPSRPTAPTPSVPDAKTEEELASAEVERRVEEELAQARSRPEAPVPPAPYAASCPNTATSPLLAACRPGKPANGCNECPSYTGFDGLNNGQLEIVLRGSFSGPYEEAIVSVTGCEAHAENYGGLLLTRKVDGGWVRLVYLPGIVPEKCQAGPQIEGASRVVCFEQHGLNSGTYETIATLIDFRTRRVDHLLYAMCEDGIDVERVRWAGVDKREVQVSVAYGVERHNDGDQCVDVRGAPRRAELFYAETSGEYAPTSATETLLRKLKPRNADQMLDPAVAAATGASERIPRELLPERSRQSWSEQLCLEP
jgi:hypothetical protein